MADLPALLCGPILRRCDESLVTVWLATSVELDANATIALHDCSGSKAKALVHDVEKRTVKVGANLYVHLLLAKAGKIKFPRGKLLGYTLDLGTITFDSKNLVYGRLSNLMMPTFFLQEKSDGIRVMHGSCRKPYGMGPDSLAIADSVLAYNALQSEFKIEPRQAPSMKGQGYIYDLWRGRPAVLYMTGDQIYADDVEEHMFHMLRTLATQLLGYEEELPIARANFMMLQKLTFGRERKNFTLYDVKFTTEDGEGHLLGLGEFAAMYLMVWSQAVWDREAVRKLPDDKWRYETPVGQDDRKPAARVRDMYSSLPAVRRALANVPTYMIFDDHDVTDDWNLDADWYDKVSKSVPGRRVVANALAAYFLFQHWGNEPDGPAAKQLLPVVEKFCRDQLEREGRVYHYTDESKKYEDTLWNFHEWSFGLATTPVSLFVDMRTERDLHPAGTGPGLTTKAARKKMKALARAAGHATGDLLILISSAPVFNVGLLALGQRIQRARGVPVADLDWEQWSNNVAGRHDFLSYLIREVGSSSTIFLSGEVHFGMTGVVDYYLEPLVEDIRTGRDMTFATRSYGRFVQLTSSALKNENRQAGSMLVRQPLPGLDSRTWTHIGVTDTETSAFELLTDFELGPDARVPWIESGTLVHDGGEALAAIEGHCNLGVVTIEKGATAAHHDFYLLMRDITPYAPTVQAMSTTVSLAANRTFRF